MNTVTATFQGTKITFKSGANNYIEQFIIAVEKFHTMGLTEATVKTLGSKPEAVEIIFTDIKKHDWATGGVLWSERKD